MVSLSQSNGLRGEIRVPADKSIVHRAILFNAIASGSATIKAFFPGRDNLGSARVMQQLGVSIEIEVPRETFDIASDEGLLNLSVGDDECCVFKISGGGYSALSGPTSNLYCGNSGTTARLMTGILAGCPFSAVLDGDESLRKRPFARVTNPLSTMGANFSSDMLPLTVRGGELQGVNYESKVASAQVKTAMLLAGLRASGTISVREPTLSRDHTERMFAAMGVELERRQHPDGSWEVSMDGGQRLTAIDVDVPSDFSQATFFAVAASIIPNSHVVIKNVCCNATRTGALDVLRGMGADISLLNEQVLAGEEVADIEVKYAPLKGVNVCPEDVVRAIDEIPVLSIAAAFAEGQSVFEGIAELRVKESDRVAMVESLLRQVGITVSSDESCLMVSGGKNLDGAKLLNGGGDWSKSGDHRILMSGAILGVALGGSLKIEDLAAIETSFPNFQQCFEALMTDGVGR